MTAASFGRTQVLAGDPQDEAYRRPVGDERVQLEQSGAKKDRRLSGQPLPFVMGRIGRNLMSRIVVSEFVSVDGVAEAPGGEPGYRHTNWVGERFDDAWVQFKVEEVLAHDVLLSAG